MFRLVGLLLLLSFPAANSKAQTLLVEVGNGTPAGYYGDLMTRGIVFITNRDVTVRSLGFYDHGGDGLVTSHRVAIGSGAANDPWPFAGAQVVVPAGTEAYYEGGFRWVNLETPITLVANVYYTLAGEITADVEDPYLFPDYTPGSVVFADFITGSAGRYGVPGAWGNPSNQVPNGNVYIVANLSEELMGIPEPGTMAITAFGLLVIAFALRKRSLLAGRE